VCKAIPAYVALHPIIGDYTRIHGVIFQAMILRQNTRRHIAENDHIQDYMVSYSIKGSYTRLHGVILQKRILHQNTRCYIP